ncbi:hypothetical protein DS893_12090 [Vibrionales bacterium C3R12]|nr:hypothetical protein DS893_12090 [Vibrionales bacterium C3R12]
MTNEELTIAVNKLYRQNQKVVSMKLTANSYDYIKDLVFHCGAMTHMTNKSHGKPVKWLYTALWSVKGYASGVYIGDGRTGGCKGVELLEKKLKTPNMTELYAFLIHKCPHVVLETEWRKITDDGRPPFEVSGQFAEDYALVTIDDYINRKEILVKEIEATKIEDRVRSKKMAKRAKERNEFKERDKEIVSKARPYAYSGLVTQEVKDAMKAMREYSSLQTQIQIDRIIQVPTNARVSGDKLMHLKQMFSKARW